MYNIIMMPMNSGLDLPSDVELVWDPRPDEGGVKRGDSFCFLKTGTDGAKTFWKEYPYDVRVIQRYHKLQNQIAQLVNTEDIVAQVGKRVNILVLPEDILGYSRDMQFLSPYVGCRVQVPYVVGTPHNRQFSLTEIIRERIAPHIKIQTIQSVNCKETEGGIIVTDIAWDIPTFLRDNPSEDVVLNELVAHAYHEWSQYMCESLIPEFTAVTREVLAL